MLRFGYFLQRDFSQLGALAIKVGAFALGYAYQPWLEAVLSFKLREFLICSETDLGKHILCIGVGGELKTAVALGGLSGFCKQVFQGSRDGHLLFCEIKPVSPV